jgi:hypothetical protein
VNGYASVMADVLTAKDLWPLVQKLPHDEQVRLAQLALAAAAGAHRDAEAYRTAPPAELGSDDDALAWEAEGWDDIDAER